MTKTQKSQESINKKITKKGLTKHVVLQKLQDEKRKKVRKFLKKYQENFVIRITKVKMNRKKMDENHHIPTTSSCWTKAI